MFGLRRKGLGKLSKLKRRIPMYGVRTPDTSTREVLEYCKTPIHCKPPAPGSKDTSRLDKISNNSTCNPPIINITGVSEHEAKELTKILSEYDFGILDSRKYKILPRKNTLTYIYTLESEDKETYTDDTIQEINIKLNSNEEFINIGNVVVKRKSVIQVIKTDKEFKENES